MTSPQAADARGPEDPGPTTDARGPRAPGPRAAAEGTEPPDLTAGAGEKLPVTIAALTEEDLEPAQRRALLGRVVAEVRARGVSDLFKPKAALRWVADALGDVAPHIPVRSRETLRRHHDGLDDDALADRLIRNAARATASVGAASGGVAAIEWVATPSLLSAPILLAAETVAVVAIEVKLIGELHEVYGRPVTGTGAQRAVALLQAWSQRRGISPLAPGAGMAAVLGTAARKELRDRLLRRFGRNLTTLGPMLTGAAVAGFLNRRATQAVGAHIRDDLKKSQPPAITAG